jgi:hypothetical protein
MAQATLLKRLPTLFEIKKRPSRKGQVVRRVLDISYQLQVTESTGGAKKGALSHQLKGYEWPQEISK